MTAYFPKTNTLGRFFTVSKSLGFSFWTIGSREPPLTKILFLERSGILSGISGTIGLNKIAAESTSGRSNSILAAIFTPLNTRWPLHFVNQSYRVWMRFLQNWLIRLYGTLSLRHQKLLRLVV